MPVHSTNGQISLCRPLYTSALGTATAHFVVSMNTNLNEETNHSFIINWTEKMASLQHDFIYMPCDDEQYSFVVNEYSDMGLTGCVGSVDCVHIGWDQCPSQYFQMYTGKEGFPSIAYEVICISQEFIQAVSPSHPGARKD